MASPSEVLVRRMREARRRLAAMTIADPALAICLSGLARLEEALSRPLRVVILGGYNAGKTSVADALIGDGLLPTSVVAHTKVPALITHAKAPALYGIGEDGTRIAIDSRDPDALAGVPYQALQVALPLARLEGYQILDTPSAGTPETFVADADIVIWCTVATRAWTESERAAWCALPERCRRHALLVVTHKHALNGEDEAEQVTERLRTLTSGLFRDIVLIDTAGEERGVQPGDDGIDLLRAGLDRRASEIRNRRAEKAEKIVRRLGRLAFHEFGRKEVPLDSARMLAGWEARTETLLSDLRERRKAASDVIEDLLAGYASVAERLRPGIVTGDGTAAAFRPSRALAAPMRWPKRDATTLGLVAMLASDLTGLLRMLAGAPTSLHAAVRAEYRTTRAIMLSLADLDSAFDALGRMLGSAAPSRTSSDPMESDRTL